MEKLTILIIAITLVWIAHGKIDSNFDIIVAKDGSGNFSKISDAVKAAPNYRKQRYYILIKAGIYVEQVLIGKEKTSLAFIGEGMDVTIITNNKSNGTGSTTFESATVGISGERFIAKYITFNNSAGQANGQAVALRSNSQFSAFYQCRFQGYQDTLYVSKGTQFYRGCEIFGTVDIIFGDATVVFQDCGIYVHNPGSGHSNVITAQGRDSLLNIVGISIHNCTIKAANDFDSNSGIKTYLGRPWRPYSTVVIMQSLLSDIIDPKGWLQWGNDTSSLASLYYGEYNNSGIGASTAKRVSWKGYRVMNSTEAEKFTVRNFINGQTWLDQTGIPFSLDLI